MKQWVRNLFGMMVRPRETMRRILNDPERHAALPLVIAAALSGTLSELAKKGVGVPGRELNGWLAAGVIVGGLILGLLVIACLFYLFAGLALFVSRLMGGEAGWRDVRLALAWGLAPVIAAIAYRFPLAIYRGFSPGAAVEVEDFAGLQVMLSSEMLPAGCGLTLVLAVLEIAVFFWWLVTTSHTVAEANRFTIGRGAAVVGFALAAPFIVAIAAVLAMRS